ELVHRARNEHGVPSVRANRASKAIPLGGYVLGNQEMLGWPAGQVTTCFSQSTAKLPLSKPSPARACQLGVRVALDQKLGISRPVCWTDHVQACPHHSIRALDGRTDSTEESGALTY